jgi:hypothetical protein
VKPFQNTTENDKIMTAISKSNHHKKFLLLITRGVETKSKSKTKLKINFPNGRVNFGYKSIPLFLKIKHFAAMLKCHFYIQYSVAIKKQKSS